REGKIVVLPTETVYGAAGLLNHDKSLAGLKAIRAGAGGNSSKPMTIHLARPEQAMRYLGEVGETATRLMKKLWPGPVALVFDVPAERRAQVSADLGVAENEIYADGKITLRCPDHIVATDVIGRFDGPIVVTVAGNSPQGPAEAIATELDGKVDLILDGGPTRFSKPSTILH